MDDTRSIACACARVLRYVCAATDADARTEGDTMERRTYERNGTTMCAPEEGCDLCYDDAVEACDVAYVIAYAYREGWRAGIACADGTDVEGYGR